MKIRLTKRISLDRILSKKWQGLDKYSTKNKSNQKVILTTCLNRPQHRSYRAKSRLILRDRCLSSLIDDHWMDLNQTQLRDLKLALIKQNQAEFFWTALLITVVVINSLIVLLYLMWTSQTTTSQIMIGRITILHCLKKINQPVAGK